MKKAIDCTFTEVIVILTMDITFTILPRLNIKLNQLPSKRPSQTSSMVTFSALNKIAIF